MVRDAGRMEYKKTDNVHIDVTLRGLRMTIVAVEKAICITYSECVSVA